MAFSYQTHTIVGSGVQNFNLTIGYVAREHILCYLDGVSTAFTWVTDTQISIDVTGATELVIRRNTPKDDETDLVVDFEDAATITEAQLDLVMRQLIFIAQEAIDEADVAMQKNSGLTAWDAEGLPISDLGAPVSNNDAVRLIDLVNAVITAGSLPPVTSAVNGYMLLVVAGAWATVSPADTRTALGLTSLATTSPGVASGQVPVLTTGGEIPAGVKGNNLDITTNPSIAALQALVHYGGAVVGSYTNTAANITCHQHTPAGPTDVTWVNASAAHARLDTLASYGLTAGAWPDGVTAALSTYGGVSNGIVVTNPTARAARFLAIFEANLDFNSPLAAERSAHLIYGTTTSFVDTTIGDCGTSAATVAGTTSQVQIGDTVIYLTESRTVTGVSATEITIDSAFSTFGTRVPFLIIPTANAARPRIATCIAARLTAVTATQLDASLSPRTDFDNAATWAAAQAMSGQGTGEIRRTVFAGFTVGAGAAVDVAGVVANLNGASSASGLIANYRKNPYRLTIIRLT